MTTDRVHPEALRRYPEGWTWREPTRGEHFRRCSYCGSIHPDDLAVEPVLGRIEWADRKYGYPHKLYIDVPNRAPDVLVPISRTNFPQTGFVPFEEMTDEQRASAPEHGWGAAEPGSWWKFGPRKSHHAKFYSEHLADPALSDETRERVEQIGGLRFNFEDGRIGWTPWTAR